MPRNRTLKYEECKELFSVHLDLSPLRGRRAGKVRCIFHQERTASLSVDLDAGVFHCFGCGAQGGVKRFAAMVGETPITPGMDTRPSPEETPWLIATRRAAGQPWSKPHIADLYAVSDWIRLTRREVVRVRAEASDWCALAAAAHLETLANAAEAELDAIYADGAIS